MDLVSVTEEPVAGRAEILDGALLVVLPSVSLWSCSSSVIFILQGRLVES